MLLCNYLNYKFGDDSTKTGIFTMFLKFDLFLSVPVMLLKEKDYKKVWIGSKVYHM